jgi:hypothetical protein
MITGSRTWAQDAIVDLGVIVGGFADARERARSHQDDAPADLLDGRDLLFIGADHVVDAVGGLRRKMIGAGSGKDHAVARFRGGNRTADQLERIRPAQAHAALRGVHRLGDPEAKVPEMSRNAMVRSQSIGASSHGSQSASGSATTCAAAKATRFILPAIRAGKLRGADSLKHFHRAVGARQLDRERFAGAFMAVHAEPPVKKRISVEPFVGFSSPRSHRQLRNVDPAALLPACSAFSTSCTPLAPSISVYL